MAINPGRMVITPEWAMHHRSTVETSALALGEVFSIVSNDEPWDPFTDPDSQPGGVTKRTIIYRGRMRVQPNKDWRARKQRFEGESVTEHAYRIQVPFNGNELSTVNQFPNITANDIVRVTGVLDVNGVKLDQQIEVFNYIVRNVVPSSNSWWRTMLCDIILDSELPG